jgi:excisionase family DNA binding protein
VGAAQEPRGSSVPKDQAPRRVGISDAAQHAGVCPKTIRRWIAAGDLPAYRVGPRLIKIDLADLDAMFQPIGGGA